MTLSLQRLADVAAESGFNIDTVERVIRLMDLLEAIEAHPHLRGKFALKGGTALNLFVLAMQRLSVDIDLNFVDPITREDLEKDRSSIVRVFEAVYSRAGYTIQRAPTKHAGGKWRLGYASVSGGTANLEVDVDFMYRVVLWDPELRSSASLSRYAARNIRLMAEPELAAGKLVALLSRAQARDLFDAHQLLTQCEIDTPRLRIAFAVYGGMSRTDWRTADLYTVALDPADVERSSVSLDEPARGFPDSLPSALNDSRTSIRAIH